MELTNSITSISTTGCLSTSNSSNSLTMTPSPVENALSMSSSLSNIPTEEISEMYAQALTSFVPEVVKHALHGKDKIEVPYCETFYAAALFADVSGFTAMSQALASKGTRGTEELPQHINSYLGQIVRLIISFGGDVVKFAGDALLCVWLPDPSKGQSEEQLELLTHLATKCALDIQKEYGVMKLAGAKITENRRGKTEEPALRVKLGIGAGKCSLLIVGGILNRCEYLVCGDALMQAFKCEVDCLPEQVVISKEAYEVLGDLIECKPISSSKVGNMLVSKAKQIRRGRFERLNVTPELAKKMKDYIPSAVRPHLQLASTSWTGELREVTVLFINLPFEAKRLVDLDKSHKAGILKTVQKNIRVLQSVIYKYQGSLNKFLVDDKGSTVMAVFGLPPVAHYNDPVRAVLAALELQKRFGRLSKHTSAALGLASGIVFSGLIGGTTGSRREYTVLGSQVNLAARLMGLAKKNSVQLGQVICDRSVYEKAQKEVRIAWLGLNACYVKGLDDPIEIFRPISVNYEIVPFKIGNAKNLKTSDSETLNKVNSCFDTVVKTRESQIIFVEGEISVGKSTLLAQIKAGNQHKAWFLWGKADCFHALSKMNYMVWKQVMLEFSQKYSMSLRRNRYKLQTWIKQIRPDLEAYLYLLTDILQMGTELEVPFKKDFDRVNSTLSDETLAQYRHDLLICLLGWVARKKTIAVVVDEIQFLDVRDWQLTRRVAFSIKNKLLKNVVLLLGGVPMDNRRYVPHFTPKKRIIEYIELKNTSDVMISPRLWTWNQTKEWIITELEVRDCSKHLVNIIHFECGGRPGFCAEFLHNLGDSKDPWIQMLVNKNDKSDRKANFHEVIEEKLKVGVDVPFPIPPYIQSITAAYLDSVDTELLMCMKTAAVICKAKGNRSRLFEEELLRATHPVNKMAEPQQLRKSLLELKNMGFIQFVGTTNLGLAHALTLRPHESDNEQPTEKENDCEVENERDTETLPSKSLQTENNSDDSSVNIDDLPLGGLSSASWEMTKPNREGNELINPYTGMEVLSKNGNKSISSNEENNDDEITNSIKNSKRPNPKHDSNTLSSISSILSGNGESEDSSLHKNGQREIKKSKSNLHHRRDSSLEIDDSTDPMPSIISLMQEPSAEIPYKRGRMYKRGVTAFNFTEKERFFVFKHHTLYWFKETDKEQYPVNRIKFAPGLDIRLKREDDMHLKIQTARKHYVLRVEKKKDLNEWTELFKKALKGDKDTPQLLNVDSSRMDGHNDMDNNEEDHFSQCHVYEFSYGFLRDVIYEQTLHAQRQQLHSQASKYIQTVLSKSYDRNLAALQERHQELGSEKDRREADPFAGHSRLKRARNLNGVYVLDLSAKPIRNPTRGE